MSVSIFVFIDGIQMAGDQILVYCITVWVFFGSCEKTTKPPTECGVGDFKVKG